MASILNFLEFSVESMTFTHLAILIGVICILIIASSIYYRIRLPRIRGKIGERTVNAALSYLPPDRYFILSDLLYKNGPHTTQIDHIVVSVYGIFVIETKNYKGRIYGNVNKEYWIQKLRGTKNKLYNPIFQNDNHILFLLRKFDTLLEYDPNIFSIVVFLSASKIKLKGEHDNVIWVRKLRRYIRSFNQKVMTMEEAKEITTMLQEHNIKDRVERNAHKRNVKNAIKNRENKMNHGICPQCGGNLVLVHGKYGDFYGCSNFPRCKYNA